MMCQVQHVQLQDTEGIGVQGEGSQVRIGDVLLLPWFGKKKHKRHGEKTFTGAVLQKCLIGCSKHIKTFVRRVKANAE